MIELPSLYDHQESMRDETRSALAEHGAVILCAPPGVGKTRMAKWILGSAANNETKDNQSGFSLFTVHRRGLVDNASNSFRETPYLEHGVIMSGVAPYWEKKTQVASIDTLLAWFIENDEYNLEYTFDLIIFDEAHSHHPKFARFLKRHNDKRESMGLLPAFVIGLTATPQAKGLADVYKEIILGPSTQWLIDNKFLSPFRYFRATQGKLDKLVLRGGEYTNKSVSEAMDGLSGDLVNDWKRLAEGRPTVGFFPRRSHAQDAARLLTEAGLRVAYVDGNTPDEERKEIFDSLNNHTIDYICNVQVIERGTDIPRIGCVQLCVAIASIARYRQMIGRGSRCHPQKTDCIILDHANNVLRNGFFEDDPQWTLDITTKDPGEVGARPAIECPQCSSIYRGGKCRSCGYEPSEKERRSQGLEFDGAELKEVTREERKEKAGKSPEDLMVSALYMAGRSSKTWRQACGIFKSLNKKQGTNFRVPKTIQVGGNYYAMIPYGSIDSNRRVNALFPFTVGQHGGDYLKEARELTGTPY